MSLQILGVNNLLLTLIDLVRYQKLVGVKLFRRRGRISKPFSYLLSCKESLIKIYLNSLAIVG